MELFDIKKEKKKIDKENVYDKLNDAMEIHGQSEVEKDVFGY